MSIAPKVKGSAKQWGVWVFVKWKPGAPDGAWNEWKKESRIKEAWSFSGAWDCLLWIDLEDPREIEKLVWSLIRQNKWVEKTETHWAKKGW